MVKMALDKLSDEDIVELDDDKKAAMVSNLLVVLCGDDSACISQHRCGSLSWVGFDGEYKST